MRTTLGCTLTLAALLAAASPALAEPAQGAPVARGVALEVSRAWVSLGADASGEGTLNGLFVGWRHCRLTVGVEAEVGVVKEHQLALDGSVANAKARVFAAIPGVRYALASSASRRVELFALADFGFGIASASGTDIPSERQNVLVFDLGVGARYWLRDSFAVTVSGGWRGEYRHRILGEEEEKVWDGAITDFAALGIAAVF